MDGKETTVTTEVNQDNKENATEQKSAGVGNGAEQQTKTFTEADIEALKKEWAKEAKKQADEAAKKAEELAKLSEDEKKQKLLEEANARAAELEKKIKQQELANFTRTKLVELEVPEEASKFIIGEDEETIIKNAKEFKNLLSKLVQEGVDKRFKDNGYTPQGGNGNTPLQSGTFEDAVASALGLFK